MIHSYIYQFQKSPLLIVDATSVCVRHSCWRWYIGVGGAANLRHKTSSPKTNKIPLLYFLSQPLALHTEVVGVPHCVFFKGFAGPRRCSKKFGIISSFLFVKQPAIPEVIYSFLNCTQSLYLAQEMLNIYYSTTDYEKNGDRDRRSIYPSMINEIWCLG